MVLKARAVSGGSATKIYETLSGYPVNFRFVERILFGTRKGEPRVSMDFPTFSEFIEERTKGLGPSGCVWEKVVEKRRLDYVGLVYDFTVDHRDHNFIAGGIVVSNCGVRLMRTNLTEEEVRPRLRDLVVELFNSVPCGVGVGGRIMLSKSDYKELIQKGAKWAIERGWGDIEDLERIEDHGTFPGGDLDAISQRALERGKDEIGTLGSGNHFLEVDVVDQVYTPAVADAFGLFRGQICVLIHCGSRGFGHQICTDYIDRMLAYMRREGINLPDKQLACAHIRSKEGRDYLSAFAVAVNYAWTNRQIIMDFAREAFYSVFRIGPKDLGGHLVYDVSHNIAKFEEHKVNGKTKRLCVHRKGATRAFPKGHHLIPEIYRDVGQPVFIPGDMGRASFVLVGTEAALEETFGSTCHGAGRVLSRNKALKMGKGRNLFAELEEKGIIVMARGKKTVAEEMPEAYKEAEDVCDVVHNAGIAKKVARLRPIGVIKG